MNKLDYLNLELSQASRFIISSDNNSLKCLFYKDSVDHIFHSENSQLNTIVDLIINLGKNLELNQNKNTNLWQFIHDSLIKKNKAIQNLENKLEYLKTTFSLFEEKLVSFEKKYISLIKSKDTVPKDKIFEILQKHQEQFEEIKLQLVQLEKLVLN